MIIESYAPARVCIYVKVTDIPGNPLRRTTTVGEEFCNQILGRPFQNQLSLLGYDQDHIPANFDSPNPVSVWFVYDLNVTGELSKEQMDDIPHYVYLASTQRSGKL